MRGQLKKSRLQVLLVLIIAGLLSGCVYWRLYQTKQQLNDFDRYFSVQSSDNFTWHFKEPLIYSDDFIYLSKFQPSSIETIKAGQRWRYLFHKVDKSGQPVVPAVSYYFELRFNQQQRLTDWLLSPLFLQMAPADFLEVSLRSIGRGKLNQAKRQIKVDAQAMEKTTAELPKKANVIAHLGAPLEVVRDAEFSVYTYHFLLTTPEIKEGYEDRALTVVKLSFDEQDNLVKLAGRFVGVKLKIDYRKYLQKQRGNAV